MQKQQIQIQTFSDPIYGQNSRVIFLSGGPQCWIVDPGLPPTPKKILGFLSEQHLKPKAIMITHAHGDHIAGIPVIQAKFETVNVYLAMEEWDFLNDPVKNMSQFAGLGLQLEVFNLCNLRPDDKHRLEDSEWIVLDTSGHSPGGRSLYCAEQGIVLVGDALFSGSIGRTDFSHSDHERLIRNIRQNLLTLPDDTRVLSGHGPDTTIGHEKATNPYLS